MGTPTSGHAARERLHSDCLQTVLGLGGYNDGWMWPCASATHRRERCPGPGLGHHTSSGLLTLLSLTCLGFFSATREPLASLALGPVVSVSGAGPVDPGPIVGTHQVWRTHPLWEGVLALSLGQCTAALGYLCTADDDRLKVPTSSRIVLETRPPPTAHSGHTWCPYS